MICRGALPGPFPLNRFLCILTTPDRRRFGGPDFRLCNAPEWGMCRFVTERGLGVCRRRRGMLGAMLNQLWQVIGGAGRA